MNVILDELTPKEFFEHGGVVKINVCDVNLLNIVKKSKFTFFEYKSYIRFIRNIYLQYFSKHNTLEQKEVCKCVNEGLKFNAFIGNYKYVIDLQYDGVNSFEFGKFYYHDNKDENSLIKKDAYGITNVNFSSITEDDDNWSEYEKQRIEYGFDESELWTLDATIAKFILPRLKMFRKYNYSTPDSINKVEWDHILDEMIIGFELIVSDRKKSDMEKEFEEKSLDLFRQWFRNLWY